MNKKTEMINNYSREDLAYYLGLALGLAIGMLGLIFYLLVVI